MNLFLITGAQPKAGTGHKMQTVSVVFSTLCQGEKLCISILGQILYLFIGLDPVLYFVRSFTRPVER